MSNQITLPTVTLPSRGILYDNKIPDGVVTVSPTSVKEDKLMASIGRLSYENIVSQILQSCVSPSFPAMEMLAGDRFFLLLCIRSMSHIMPYQFQMRCLSCSGQYKYEVGIAKDILREDKIRYLPDGFTEPFEIYLPYSKHTITCRHLRGTDRQSIVMYTNERAKLGEDAGEAGYIFTIAKHIVSIDGNDKVSMSDKLTFVEGLLTPDSETMRYSLEIENACGVDTTINPVCTRCGYEEEVTMPITADFFLGNLRGLQRNSKKTVSIS